MTRGLDLLPPTKGHSIPELRDRFDFHHKWRLFPYNMTLLALHPILVVIGGNDIELPQSACQGQPHLMQGKTAGT